MSILRVTVDMNQKSLEKCKMQVLLLKFEQNLSLAHH